MKHWFLYVTLAGGLAVLTACAAPRSVWLDHTEQITQMAGFVLIQASRDTIYAEYRERGGKQWLVDGFTDFSRMEVWCPLEDTPAAFYTCQHELRHMRTHLEGQDIDFNNSALHNKVRRPGG